MNKHFIDFINPPSIIRSGVRIFCVIKNIDFKKGLDKMKKLFVDTKNEFFTQFTDDIIDIGFPINFQSGNAKYNLSMGPMRLSQIQSFFDIKEGLPDEGLFIDVDYFREQYDAKDCKAFIEEGAVKTIEMVSKIAQLMEKTKV